MRTLLKILLIATAIPFIAVHLITIIPIILFRVMGTFLEKAHDAFGIMIMIFLDLRD